MIDARLQVRLERLEALRKKARLWNRAAICWWIVAAALAVIQFSKVTSVELRPICLMTLLAAGVVAVISIWIVERRRANDFRALVQGLEAEHPDLHPLLSTAYEQERDPDSKEFHFLQQRVVTQALQHPSLRSLQESLEKKLLTAKTNHAFGLAIAVVLISISGIDHGKPQRKSPSKSLFAESIQVEPGDIELERGRSFVVTVRFDRQPPSEATLVLATGEGIRRIPLERHLDDPLFGTSLREVMESGSYHIEYGSKKTRDYRITVFEYPVLVRADASLEFPAYTGLTNKAIPDTLRITAVEGTRLSYTFQLNKPVAEASLVSKEQTIRLMPGTNAALELSDFALTSSGRFALHLRDHDGRTNRRSSEFVFQVLPNRPPDLKLNFPRGDQRVSRLQELRLEGEVMDDFGVVRYGLGYGIAGDEPKFVELGAGAARNEKRPLQYEIDLEQLGVDIDQVVSYFVWADDVGPAGEIRRNYGDMFFAEIRPFDEIFRADQSGGDGSGQEQQGGEGGQEGGGGQQTRLTELQKQIVIATWKIQREKGAAPAVSKP